MKVHFNFIVDEFDAENILHILSQQETRNLESKLDIMINDKLSEDQKNEMYLMLERDTEHIKGLVSKKTHKNIEGEYKDENHN